jgi:SAM-dependent methyltransferase
MREDDHTSRGAPGDPSFSAKGRQALDLSGEIGFWDDRAAASEYRERLAITPEQYMDQEVWLAAWKQILPPLQGLTVLDCGSGLGAIAAWCALAGARVIGFDIAQNMARLATEYAAHHGATVSMMASTFEELPLKDHCVDLAVGQYILHHTDVDRSIDELKRVVKPNGMGLFVENMALNPLIRRYLESSLFEEGVMREGSPEECPIFSERVQHMKSVCREVRLHWPSFVFFEILFSRLPLFRRRWGQALDDGLFRLNRNRESFLRNSYFAILELHF